MNICYKRQFKTNTKLHNLNTLKFLQRKLQASVLSTCWSMCKRCEFTVDDVSVSSYVPFVARTRSSSVIVCRLTMDSSNRGGRPDRPSCLLAVTSVETLASAWLDLSKCQDVNHCSSPRNNRFYYFLLITTTDFLNTLTNVVLNHTSLKM